MKDIEILKKVQGDRNQSEKNLISYKSVESQYTKSHKLYLKKLIDEAVEE